MEFNFPQLAMLGALAGGAVGFWNQIKAFATFVSGFFIIRAVAPYNAGDAVIAFVFGSCRRSPFGLRKFQGQAAYTNVTNRNELMPYESLGDDAVLFWFKRRPVLIRAITSEHGNTIVNMWAIRGTLDPRIFIKEAFAHWNSRERSKKTVSRFYVLVLHEERHQQSPGSAGKLEAPAPAQTSDALVDMIRRGLATPIGYGLQDLVRVTAREPFESYVYANEIMDALQEVRRWLDSEVWYKTRGIPWRRGWLLYGPPGTGKSTLVRSMGQVYGLPVVSLSLAGVTAHGFITMWKTALSNSPAFILIEDLDAVFDKRENISCKGTVALEAMLTFDVLLNAISGIESSDGIFLMVTTNDLSKLDPALGIPQAGQIAGMSTRPGRLDRALYIGPMAEPERRKLAANILRDCPKFIDALVIEGEKDMPAQFQDRCGQFALKYHWDMIHETKSRS